MDDADIRRYCRTYDFPLAGIDRRGDVLILVPSSLEDLPEADQLKSLADGLASEGDWRHVTFNLPESTS